MARLIEGFVVRLNPSGAVRAEGADALRAGIFPARRNAGARLW